MMAYLDHVFELLSLTIQKTDPANEAPRSPPVADGVSKRNSP